MYEYYYYTRSSIPVFFARCLSTGKTTSWKTALAYLLRKTKPPQIREKPMLVVAVDFVSLSTP